MAGSLDKRLNLDRPILRRRRKINACKPCQKRKVKCDQSKPKCRRCLTNNRECGYDLQSEKCPRISACHNQLELSEQLRRKSAQPSGKTREENTSITLNQSGHLTEASNTTMRYISSSSWKATMSDLNMSCQSQFPSEILPSDWLLLNSLDGESTSTCIIILEIIRNGEFQKLLYWYERYCHIWYPVVHISRISDLVESLHSQTNAAPSLWSLIAAICYIARLSQDACAEPASSGLPTSSWRDLSTSLLSISGYPLQLDDDSIRAAFLLAAPSITESDSQSDPSKIATILRASQTLGLHRDPLSIGLSHSDCAARRTLWWSIHALDISYSVAHALPPLTHCAKFDVKGLTEKDDPAHRLISTLSRINPLHAKVLDGIYGVSLPTKQDVEGLDKEITEACSSEITNSYFSSTESQAKFVGVSQRLSCWKLTYMLHQPYLRSAHWPRSSRSKALEACQKYAREFVDAANDPQLMPYNWIMNHFNSIHACAILLQDLIQMPHSLESLYLREVLDLCFAAFPAEAGSDWEKLQELRTKAWASNDWLSGETHLQDTIESLASLSDWDPLFASLAFEDIFTDLSA